MSDDVWMRIRAILADYVGIPAEGFDMETSLDLEYDMDSTELTEIAKKIEVEYALSIQKSTRSTWERGADIAAFVREHAGGQQSAVSR